MINSDNKHFYYKKYSLYFIISFLIMLTPILFTNTYLNYLQWISDNPELQASLWQEKTHGIACTDIYTNKKFKLLRLQKMLSSKKINTVVLGSSTAMSIRHFMVPKEQKIYNFSQNGVPFSNSDLEYLVQKEDISYYIVGIDIYNGLAWNLFRGISSDKPINYRPLKKENTFSLFKSLIKDALTTSKIKLFFYNIWTIIKSSKPKDAFLNIFYPSAEYQCLDGIVAKDFSTPYPRQCAGFRFDGSATFNNIKALNELSEKDNIQRLVAYRLKYLSSIKGYEAPISNIEFNKINKIIDKVIKNKSEILFILPPVYPYLEKSFLDSSERFVVLKIKDYLHDWALKKNITILDMSQTEEYGCRPSEFLDATHALPPCYSKILKKFFESKNKKRSGLLTIKDLNAK